MNKLRQLLFFSLMWVAGIAYGQCPQIIDGNGAASATPQWVHCNGTAYTLFIQTNIATGPYTINWGDGTSSSGAALVPPATISHNYPATLRNYTITFSEPGKGCTVTGLLVLERPVNASITRPLGSGGATTICAPGDLGFINTSTDVSDNTTFRWDFGDGSPIVTKGSNDSGITTTHTYLRNTVNCNTVVTLEAENFCTTVPSFASVGPINIYDLDDAAITPTATFLCYPDTVVGFLNTSNLNCRPQGNTVQRYEYWNFGNYWGTGDSILDWTPFANPPSLTYNLRFPGKGSYTITMIDSNMCGRDTTNTTIVIGDPPIAAFTSNKDTICEGETIRFNNNSTGGANRSYWNFGDGVWRTRGMGNQNRTFNNAGTYTIYLAVENTGGSASCTDTTSLSIHVLPGPTANFSINPASDCDSVLTAITENSSDAAKWNWNFGDGTMDTVQNPANHLYPTAGSYNIGLKVTHTNGCTDSTTQQVLVYASPVVGFTPQNVCEDVLASFTDNSTVSTGDPLVSWNWDFGDGGNSTQQHPQHQYTASGTYTLKLTASTAHCTSLDSFSIVVEPKPQAGFTLSDSLGCAPLTVSFSNTSITSTQYHWDFGDGDTSTQTTPTHTFTNNSTATINYTITLYANTAFGCSDTAQKVVQIYAKPNAAFTSNAVPECGPAKVDFTNNSTSVSSQTWYFDDGDTSTATNPSHTYQNKTLFIETFNPKLVVVSANGCVDTATQIVVVYPEPIFTFQSLPDTGCSPLTVNFPSITGAVAYKWKFGDGDSAFGPSPKHTYINATTNNVVYTATLIATSSFGCSDTNTATVLVHPNPSAIFSMDDSVSCQPHEVGFTNASTGAIKYYWNYGNGDTSDTSAALHRYEYRHTQPATQIFPVRLIAETRDGCRDTTVHNVTVYPIIKAEFQISDSVNCSPLQSTFTNTSTGAQFFNWSFGDNTGSPLPSPQHTYTNSTLKDTLFFPKLVITSAFGCQDSIADTVLIHPNPIAQYNHPVLSGCQPLAVSFFNTSSIADTSFWNFGQGAPVTNNNSVVNFTYTNTGTANVLHTIKLKVKTRHGCVDSSTSNVDVFPLIDGRFSASDTVGCTDLQVMFTDQSVGAQFYNWSFGNNVGSAAKHPMNIYQNTLLRDSVFTVKQKVRSTYGCEDSSTLQIRVYPKPIASFLPDVTRGCQPLSVTFNNNSQLNARSFWDFGDGDTSKNNTNPSHSYTHNQSVSKTFTSRLIVETIRGCRDTVTQQVEVYPKITADFDASDTTGCSALTVRFTNQSIGESTYNWDFGDGKTDRIGDPIHIFENLDTANQTFTTQLKVTSIFGCTDSITKNILVYPQPKAAFTATPVNQKFPSATVGINNTSSQGPWQYQWSFGDTTRSTLRDPGNKTYVTWGKYNIQLIVSGQHCHDTVDQNIVIDPPRAVVEFNASGVGCRPLTVQFTNRTQYGKQFIWNFGDGGISNLENPAPYTYYNAGKYSITLTVIGEDNDVVTVVKLDSITVHERATAFFDYRPKKVSVPRQPILLYNLSSFADRWSWDVGDGTLYTEKNPEHFYQEGGVYPVTLIADNEFGCADTLTIENAVEAESKGSLQFPTAFTPDPSGSNGGRYDPQTLDNDIFFPIYEGVVAYQLLVFNRWGEIVFETEDVEIGWDGYYRGTEKLCAQDVYIWKAVGKYVNGKQFEEAGEVTLLR